MQCSISSKQYFFVDYTLLSEQRCRLLTRYSHVTLPAQVPTRNLIFWRMIYTFCFYVMVTTILMNIIFGEWVSTSCVISGKVLTFDHDDTL